MLRTIATFAAILALIIVGGATWTALQPPIESLIVPGAVDVQVVATGWGQRQITIVRLGHPTTGIMRQHIV
jgi:hypothetical protein